jgi:hypothetical protein
MDSLTSHAVLRTGAGTVLIDVKMSTSPPFDALNYCRWTLTAGGHSHG